jgi:hypothetical protein
MADGRVIATKEKILEMEKMTLEERANAVRKIRVANTYAVVQLAVTYYTGKVDTVPHVPDRCYVADGFQPTEYKVKEWMLGNYSTGVPRKASVRFIDFEDQAGREMQDRCVTYFFHANGKYEEDPKAVRMALQNLFERYGYFAKIEVMTLLPMRPGAGENDPLKKKDREAASGAVQRFLTASLPEIEKLLPDWQSYHNKK